MTWSDPSYSANAEHAERVNPVPPMNRIFMLIPLGWADVRLSDLFRPRGECACPALRRSLPLPTREFAGVRPQFNLTLWHVRQQVKSRSPKRCSAASRALSREGVNGSSGRGFDGRLRVGGFVEGSMRHPMPARRTAPRCMRRMMKTRSTQANDGCARPSAQVRGLRPRSQQHGIRRSPLRAGRRCAQDP